MKIQTPIFYANCTRRKIILTANVTREKRINVGISMYQCSRREKNQCRYHVDNHDDVITHLEPDILEREVKWALGSITINKARVGDGTPAELFQIGKCDAVKVLHSICQQIWNTQQWLQGWKSVSLHSKAKECSNYCTIAQISHANKGMLKILQAKLQPYVKQGLSYV